MSWCPGSPRVLPRSFALIAFVAAIFTPHAGRADVSRCPAPPAELLDALAPQAPTLRREVLRLALDAASCAAQQRLLRRPELLTVIDYSKPSLDARLWVFDTAARRLLFHEHVAHGVASGGNLTTSFSNLPGSRQTSLGLFITAETYVGRNGYSLRLDGVERGVNDRARARAIVMHGAPYVNPVSGRKQGRLGRSWGCPAVRSEIARTMIDTIKGGSALFAYYPDRNWLAMSRFLPVGQSAALETPPPRPAAR